MAINNQNATLEGASSGDQTLYTTPTVTEAIITKASIYNDNAANVTLVVNIRRGSATATTNRYINTVIASQEDVSLTSVVGTVLNTGDIINVNPGAASALNIDFSIKEVTT